MRTTSKALAFLALACLAACDSRTAAEFKAERANRQYQEAMDDYSAGRLDAAVKGFEKVLRADPGNASARFQLACLQQDSRHDYVGAFCNYREYIQQAPDSDKAKMAKERLAICERQLADELAKKLNLAGNESIAAEVEHLRGEIKELKAASDKSEAARKEAYEAYTKQKGESERLRKLLASMGEADDEPKGPTDVVATVKDLLDDDPDAPSAAASLGEAKALDALADGDDEPGASSLLPQQAADAKDRKKAAEDAEKKAKSARAAEKDAIPETYVVQDGDTLYKIAIKFYGKTSAWKRIREANKDTISTDGRVRQGQTIRLPK